MELQKILGYVPFALLLVLVYLSYLVVRPFLATVIGALVIAYIFYPLYARLERHMHRNIAGALVIVLIIVLLSVPVIFILNSVVKEANSAYLHTKDFFERGVLSTEECAKETLACKLAKKTNNLITGSTIEYYLRETVKRLALFFTQNAASMLLAIPSAILDFCLMLFIVFFALRDGIHLFRRLDSILPLNPADREKIFGGIKHMTSGVVYGSVVVAVLQGIMGGLGFFLFGYSSPVIWGIVIGLLSFIPLIGSMLVWFPASLLLLLEGLAAGEGWIVARGVGFLIYGFICITSLENVIKSLIIGNHAKIHPLIIIVGVIGGLKAFGLLGLVVGPLILELLITFIGIVKEHWWARKKSARSEKAR